MYQMCKHGKQDGEHCPECAKLVVENSNSAALRKTIRKWWENVPSLKLSDDDIDELICALPSTGNQQPHVNIAE